MFMIKKACHCPIIGPSRAEAGSCRYGLSLALPLAQEPHSFGVSFQNVYLLWPETRQHWPLVSPFKRRKVSAWARRRAPSRIAQALAPLAIGLFIPLGKGVVTVTAALCLSALLALLLQARAEVIDIERSAKLKQPASDRNGRSSTG